MALPLSHRFLRCPKLGLHRRPMAGGIIGRHIEGSRNRTNLAPGLEWFSDGKLVVVPPVPGHEWICETEIADAPAWLKVMVLSPLPRRAEKRNSSGPLVTATNINSSSHVPKPIYMLILRGMPNASRHSQRRVRGLWANLPAKGQHRNDGLNYTVWEYRGFVQSGDLDANAAAKLLWLACEDNGYLAKDGEEVVKEVINRVLETGDRQMVEIKLRDDQPQSMSERINKRLRNSGTGMGTQPDVTIQTGNSARRTFHNIHHAAGHARPAMAPTDGEKK